MAVQYMRRREPPETVEPPVPMRYAVRPKTRASPSHPEPRTHLPPQESAMEVKLVVAAGSARGRVIPLPATVYTIRRPRHCHRRPHDLSASTLHCALARCAGKAVVRDLNSAYRH